MLDTHAPSVKPAEALSASGSAEGNDAEREEEREEEGGQGSGEAREKEPVLEMGASSSGEASSSKDGRVDIDLGDTSAEMKRRREKILTSERNTVEEDVECERHKLFAAALFFGGLGLFVTCMTLAFLQMQNQ